MRGNPIRANQFSLWIEWPIIESGYRALIINHKQSRECGVCLHWLEAASLSDMYGWVSGQDLASGDMEEESK
jgi:hypothetical protein